MKKLKTTTDWLNLAISKDNTRLNICEIYIDNGKAIATDSHRMHMVNDFKPNFTGYLSNNQAEYPDYKQVIPRDKMELCLIDVANAHRIIGFLESCIKLSSQKNVIVELYTHERMLHISYKDEYNESYHHTNIHCNMENYPNGYRSNFPANFLVDVLSACQLGQEFTILTGTNDFDRTPILLESGNFQAILMPMRVK